MSLTCVINRGLSAVTIHVNILRRLCLIRSRRQHRHEDDEIVFAKKQNRFIESSDKPLRNIFTFTRHDQTYNHLDDLVTQASP